MSSKRVEGSTGVKRTSRRQFLKKAAAVSGLVLGQPLLGAGAVAVAAQTRTMLRNGFVADGTGKKGFVGDVLLNGEKIEAVSETPIEVECPAIDCTGKVISPGFIDVHSHMDLVLLLEGHEEMKLPFTAQGCTTFVAGNCGWSPCGSRPGSEFKDKFRPGGLFPDFKVTWDTMAGYYDHLAEIGMTHNLVNMAGHGSVRKSMRWDDPSALSSDEMAEMLKLLEGAMDDGASGVSMGLQYTPGIFAPEDELLKIAQLVAKKDKILTVHARAYSAVAPGMKGGLWGDPHNVLALKEVIDLGRKTGARLQLSHLIFTGTATHHTYKQCLDIIDKAREEGIDIETDTYPYHCGNTDLSVVTPKWFREGLPDNYHNEEALKRLKTELEAIKVLLGFGYEDIQITHAAHPDLNQYNGMFLSEIAEERGEDPFRTIVELMSKSAKKGTTRGTWVLLHKYSNMEIIDALIKYPPCLFMSDALPVPWLMNPAAYGAFPLLMQYARDRKLITLEEAVRKATGGCADRVRLKDRGYLKPGLAADVTVFDWNSIKDNNTLKDTDNYPNGIEAVFLNGTQVLKDGKLLDNPNKGVVLRT